jgi:hypothetical protein
MLPCGCVGDTNLKDFPLRLTRKRGGYAQGEGEPACGVAAMTGW